MGWAWILVRLQDMLVISVIPLCSVHGPWNSGGPTMLGAWSCWTPVPRSSLLKCSPQLYAGHQGCCHPFQALQESGQQVPTTPETLDIILFSVSICTVNCSPAFTPSLESGKFKDLGYLLDLEKRGKCRKNTTQECLDNGLAKHDKPRHPKVHFITSFVTSTEPDTVLTLGNR